MVLMGINDIFFVSDITLNNCLIFHYKYRLYKYLML